MNILNDELYNRNIDPDFTKDKRKNKCIFVEECFDESNYDLTEELQSFTKMVSSYDRFRNWYQSRICCHIEQLIHEYFHVQVKLTHTRKIFHGNRVPIFMYSMYSEHLTLDEAMFIIHLDDSSCITNISLGTKFYDYLPFYPFCDFEIKMPFIEYFKICIINEYKWNRFIACNPRYMVKISVKREGLMKGILFQSDITDYLNYHLKQAPLTFMDTDIITMSYQGKYEDDSSQNDTDRYWYAYCYHDKGIGALICDQGGTIRENIIFKENIDEIFDVSSDTIEKFLCNLKWSQFPLPPHIKKELT